MKLLKIFDRKIKTLNYLSIIYIIIGLIGFVVLFSSCRTPKIITKEKIVVDSTAIHQRDSIASLWAAEARAMEEEKRLWAEYGVLFEDEKPCDTFYKKDSVKVYVDKKPNKVKVNADGSLEIEGRIRAFNAQVATYQKEKDSIYKVIAVLNQVKDSMVVELSKKTVTTEKETKSNWLFWLLVGLFSGAAIWHNRKGILKLIKKI